MTSSPARMHRTIRLVSSHSHFSGHIPTTPPKSIKNTIITDEEVTEGISFLTLFDDLLNVKLFLSLVFKDMLLLQRSVLLESVSIVN